jgi:hypothetical protein
MNIAQIENNLQLLVNSFDENTFIYELLLAYGQPKASIKRLQEGGLNLSKNDGEILWKKKIFFKETSDTDLHDLIDDLRIDDRITKHSPRFIIVTDYKNFLARDTKTADTLDIEILEIPRYFDFFLPLAGMEKAQHQFENPADVKAAERMGKLYDEIKKDNSTDTEEEVHSLNVFLTRLLFCFFAEDTNIFNKSQFTHSIINHTQEDGSDLHTHFERLYQVMNTPENQRRNIPEFLNSFPYVNGGLFMNQHDIPQFSRKSRNAIIESGELDWSVINPDIFGSMIQAVITPEHRGGLGMHYTSVPNIMKVIEPLFLNDFYEEFESSKGNSKRLLQLLNRIWNTKYFDPACGSGNFLIITYKELRKLEMKIFKELNEFPMSNVSLNQFYGIELDDFAHEVAILSLWLAEHQMNQVFFKEFGRSKPALPLSSAGNIVHGNACRLDWEVVCPKGILTEVYLMGNPPFIGSRYQIESHKKDMDIVINSINNYRKLDYVASWFYLATNYLKNSPISAAGFVSTNSITQGEQANLLFGYIFKNDVEIQFAYRTFAWKNNAKNKAAVEVVIIGLKKTSSSQKLLYDGNNIIKVDKINAYLSLFKIKAVEKRNSPLSFDYKMVKGCYPTDGEGLILNDEQYKLISHRGKVNDYLKPFIGTTEFLHDKKRYCLYLNSDEYNDIKDEPFIKERIEIVVKSRLSSKKENTRKLASVPYKFEFDSTQNGQGFIVPCITSQRRKYLPIGIAHPGDIVYGTAQVLYTNDLYIFGILSCRLHVLWMSVTCGRMKSDYNYSSTLCFNTFPFPKISHENKSEIEIFVYKILEQRELFSENTIAQLYDPDKMPDGLREAHHQLDLAVERCYRSKPFEGDEERLEYLFKLYEEMIQEEKTRGTLFEMESKPKKKKK